MKQYVYRNVRPQLVIESKGGRSLGHCYTASSYRITSLSKLTAEKIQGLFNLGFIGYGQEFNVLSKCDGTEEPAGIDQVPCTVVDERTGEVLNEPPTNPYSGKLYAPSATPYYVYDTESRCDSGD